MSKLPTSRLPVTPSKVATAAKSSLRPPQPVSTHGPTSQQVSPTTGTDNATPTFSLGDRVMTNGKNGTIAFIGSTKFADGDWIGVILDEAQGKNDGSYEGTRYFETEPNRGLFCRPAKVQRLVQNIGATTNNDTDNANEQSKAPSEPTPVSTNEPPTVTPITSTLPTSTAVSEELCVGDRVVVSGSKFGTLKYIGKIHVAEGVWCGIQLDEPMGKNDGSVSGKRYFTCQQRYGLFSPVARVEKVNKDITPAQIAARKASVSSSTANARPLHRSNSQESLQSNLSGFSTSSNSISRIPMRTPGKPAPPKPAPHAYTTPNTKSLLTQAAATLAATQPSSNQVANLIQTIREKDIFIEKLQQQREQDRSEFSRAAQQVDQMESQMLTFKQQLTIKESENEALKKEQYETKQRLEDLEFQLEEYKLTESTREQSSTTSIPDGYRLMSPKDLEIYEQIKGKLLETESTNQKLVLEKQTFQDEHRQELKRQAEVHETEIQSRLNECNAKFQEQINSTKAKSDEQQKQMEVLIEQLRTELAELKTKGEGQTVTLSAQLQERQSQLESIQKQNEALQTQLSELQSKGDLTAQTLTSQLQEKQAELLQADKAKDEALAAFKQLQEEKITAEKQAQNHLDQLKAQLGQLQAQGEGQTTVLSTQLLDHQAKLEQANKENEEIRSKLKQLHDEKETNEKQANDHVDLLKKQLNELKTNGESQSISLSTQLVESQSKLELAERQIEEIRQELRKAHDEKTVREKEANERMNKLKHYEETIIPQLEQQYVTIKTDLENRDRTATMALSERETHYEQQIKDYQEKIKEFMGQNESFQQEIKRRREEMEEKNIEHQKQFEQLQKDLKDQAQQSASQCNELRQQITQLEQTKSTNETQLNEMIKSLQDQNQQILAQHQMQTKEQENQAIQRIETLEKLKETQKREFDELNDKYNQLQNLHQQHTISNDNDLKEKRNLIEQLQKRIHEIESENQVQRVHVEQKAKAEEALQNTIAEYEKKLTSLKNAFAIEKETINAEHEEEKNRLTTELQKARAALLENSENQDKTSSNSSTNAKQLEYELTEAKYQIEKLQKQIQRNASSDDRSALESQISFLNDVIVDLRNANENLKKEIEFLKNPFLDDENQLGTNEATSRIKSSLPRLYCDMCEVFDQHDTDDCPKQSSMVDEPATSTGAAARERILPAPRQYCDKCEEFGHDCDEIDETY